MRCIGFRRALCYLPASMISFARVLIIAVAMAFAAPAFANTRNGEDCAERLASSGLYGDAGAKDLRHSLENLAYVLDLMTSHPWAMKDGSRHSQLFFTAVRASVENTHYAERLRRRLPSPANSHLMALTQAVAPIIHGVIMAQQAVMKDPASLSSLLGQLTRLKADLEVQFPPLHLSPGTNPMDFLYDSLVSDIKHFDGSDYVAMIQRLEDLRARSLRRNETHAQDPHAIQFRERVAFALAILRVRETESSAALKAAVLKALRETLVALGNLPASPMELEDSFWQGLQLHTGGASGSLRASYQVSPEPEHAVSMVLDQWSRVNPQGTPRVVTDAFGGNGVILIEDPVLHARPEAATTEQTVRILRQGARVLFDGSIHLLAEVSQEETSEGITGPIHVRLRNISRRGSDRPEVFELSPREIATLRPVSESTPAPESWAFAARIHGEEN